MVLGSAGRPGFFGVDGVSFGFASNWHWTGNHLVLAWYSGAKYLVPTRLMLLRRCLTVCYALAVPLGSTCVIL